MIAAGTIGFPLISFGANKQVVVIGGGAGGATAAKYLRMLDASIDVTLIEQNAAYHTCFMSNEVLSGEERTLDSIKFSMSLKNMVLKLFKPKVSGIDAEKKLITVEGGQTFNYDRLIVSPGVEMKWGAITGYDEAASEIMPHVEGGSANCPVAQTIGSDEGRWHCVNFLPRLTYRCPRTLRTGEFDSVLFEGTSLNRKLSSWMRKISFLNKIYSSRLETTVWLWYR
ncbi:MAG: FAD/NAD(P)-binding oxidoreductase [Thiotrichaceae bacterium]